MLEDPRPVYACIVNSNKNFGNPSELSAVAISFLIG